MEDTMEAVLIKFLAALVVLIAARRWTMRA